MSKVIKKDKNHMGKFQINTVSNIGVRVKTIYILDPGCKTNIL